METSHILAWTFQFETDIPNDADELLIEGEHAIKAYKTLRDSAIFTNKRLIIQDSQGLTGKKSGSILSPLFFHRHVVH